ncbi:hypothetical protein Ga0123462_1745 [Mariprofundus ferrinatatus]|uniref:Type 4 fimbrial biogenesis protein PilX N-terminal domain-containing protein n=2 Tax=Mariprofundus ferrinatatus TaxID=1921087 RepID=A0A2K8L662_9PROT|nr:hypothetical protein Ga0123462_1745 [Mariprofundus ferrinatatus]
MLATPLTNRNRAREEGFVLVTAVIMLGLLTLLSLAMFFTSRTATQTSASAQTSTEAYYYAETAVNYIAWALANDAEFDAYTNYPGAYDHAGFGEPPLPAGFTAGYFSTVGDYLEWGAYRYHPGPLSISDSGSGITGQVLYFDNSPMKDRAVCFQDDAIFSNCIDVGTDPATRVAPTMYHISVSLPRYIKMDIAADGTITPSIPQLPHQNPPVVGQDIPENGAVVWITAGDQNNSERDIEIYPLDPAGIYSGDGIVAPSTCAGGQMPSNCPCDVATITPTTAGCSAHEKADPAVPDTLGAYGAAGMGDWVSGYRIVAYAIGYVNGKASHMIRAVIR